MSLLTIATYPAEVLRVKAEEIADIDEELIKLIEDMFHKAG